MRRQLAVISLLTALSQLAAFFKLWFTAGLFGVSVELDGYNLSLVVPTLISGLLAGVIQTGFFPVRTRLHAQGDVTATRAFERSVFWGCAVLGAVLASLVVVASPLLTQLLIPQNQTAVRDTYMYCLPFVALLIPLSMACDCTGYILAMREKFAYAAGAPVINGILGGLILFIWPENGLLSLVLSTVIGLLAQFAICMFGLYKSEFSIFGSLPECRKLFRYGRDMAYLGGWILPGVFFSNVISTLPPVWAASYGEGVVSAFGYAYRLHTSLIQLLVMSSSTLILARFSTLIAQNDQSGIRRLLRQASIISLTIGVVSALMVWLLGEPVLLLLFGGKFDSEAAFKVTQLWFWLTLGVGFAILSNVFAKLWQAQARPKLMSVMAAISLLAVYVSYMLLRDTMGEQAIALALSAAPAIVVVLGFKLLTTSHRILGAH
ncbi:hypothetical protein K3169_22100 [Pseudomonas phytophila]|uniref:Uncharacterized protein n=1 Tax=Pseudomonas phytophila TaxID=2867264 RepID=A0ABY6FAY4_9PSED|nr:lipid II flippase MurJ [Pseudomonas phytophila]UXZ95012.1 hypothetical protein K3169_22100 [Pseudomonas phytophila]